MLAVIFEDQAFENFYPVSFIRPVYELKCGQTMLHEKITRALKPEKVCYFTREYLTEVVKQRTNGAKVNDLQALDGEDLLLVNGRWLMIDDASLELEGDEEIGLWEKDDTVLYARVNQKTAGECKADSFEDFLQAVVSKITSKKKIAAKVMCYPWDLIHSNAGAIVDDFKKRGQSGIEGQWHETAVLLGDKSQIYVSPTAKIQPYVTIDVTEGPVTIDDNTIVNPNSWISGPVYIGPDTLIMGAAVREGTSIGPVCRIGGEVEETIAHAYVNKWHDGFLGHSYAGEGINLGADTINSDVKNDFSNVNVYMKGEFMDTGHWKMGALIGDYTKTSIGTLFNTGSSIGLLSIILGGDGILPKYIPSFSWYINRKITKGFGLGKSLEAAKAQLAVRKREMTEAEIEVLKYVHQLTKEERMTYVKRDRKK